MASSRNIQTTCKQAGMVMMGIGGALAFAPFPSFPSLPRKQRIEHTTTHTSVSSHVINTYVSFLSGATSGLVSTCLFQPLDLVKTKMQTSSGLVSTTDVFKKLMSQKDARVFWRGLQPSLCRTVPGVGMYFGCLHAVKATVSPANSDGTYSATQNLIMGSSARLLVANVLLPFTVVKTRVESGLFQYSGVSGALVSIQRAEGIRGLYCGAMATALRDAPFSGFYLLFYSKARAYLKETTTLPNPVVSLTSGIGAGALASLLSQPQDVIKTRVQVSTTHQTMVSAFFDILKTQGVRGLYAGLAPRIMRRTFMAAVSWTVYEEVAPFYRRVLFPAHPC
eukprot:m.47766 g.47766  ORF g.47766 m.47766 type:complete len:336 (-) comp17695_c1_seq1:793-1800(-)